MSLRSPRLKAAQMQDVLTVYNLSAQTFSLSIASQPALERAVYKFHLKSTSPPYVTPSGRYVRLLTDHVTGFHFILEYVGAAPSIRVRSKIVQRIQADIRKGVSVKKQPLMCDVAQQEKPARPHDENSYDAILQAQTQGVVFWNKTPLPIRPGQKIVEYVGRVKGDSISEFDPANVYLSNVDWKTGVSCIRAPGCKCDKCKYFYDEAGIWDEVKASHAVSRPGGP
jgi:hypothetical protein